MHKTSHQAKMFSQSALQLFPYVHLFYLNIPQNKKCEINRKPKKRLWLILKASILTGSLLFCLLQRSSLCPA